MAVKTPSNTARRPRLKRWRWGMTWATARAAWLAVASLPALLGAWGELGNAARSPHYLSPGGPLAAFKGVRLALELGAWTVAGACIAALVAWLGHALWTACAMRACVAQPTPLGDTRGRWARLKGALGAGLGDLGGFARVALVQALALGLGALLWGELASRAVDWGERSGASALATFGVLPGLCALGLVGWASVVAVWAWTARAAWVLGSRRSMRRAGAVALSAMRARPLRACVALPLLMLGAQLVSGLAVLGWRQGAPSTAAGLVGWLLVWALALWGQGWAGAALAREALRIARSALHSQRAA